jgi:hypothetical protein
VAAVLALAAPVASASAQAAAGPSGIPCYPYPAFCGPDGQPWVRPFPALGFPGIGFPFGPGLLPARALSAEGLS